MTKISVLMPIWNTKEVHLKEAIQSILDQTYTDFEFIILNDSPDNRKLDKIVESYKDKRIKYFKNEKNLGITLSRNKLLDMAQGQYLAVMDHDDISLPMRFEKQVAYLDAHSEVGVLGCKAQINRNKLSKNPTNDADIRLRLMKGCSILHSSSMIRKSVLTDNNIRYEERFSPSEDYALWCRLLPHTKFHNLKEVLFKYRVHKTNTSKTQKDKMYGATLAINAIMQAENPALYNEFLSKATHKTRVRLFGFIPILTVISKGGRTKIYLFEKLLLVSCKKSIKL